MFVGGKMSFKHQRESLAKRQGVNAHIKKTYVRSTVRRREGVIWGSSGGMVVDNMKISPRGIRRQSADSRGFRTSVPIFPSEHHTMEINEQRRILYQFCTH